MYEWPSHSFRAAPQLLPPAGLGAQSSRRLSDASLLTARTCLNSLPDAALPLTTAQEQAQQATAGGAAAQAPAGARPKGPGGSAGECLKPGPATPQLQALQEAKEAAYQRNKLEPLGRPRPHGTSIPDGLGTTQSFGKALNARELEKTNQGKQTIYPGTARATGGQGERDPGQEEREVHAQYVKTHRDFGPGEQRKWGVNFKGADPYSLTFGKPPVPGTEKQLREALQPGVQDEWAGLPERLARFTLRNRAVLGMPRSANALERDLPPDFVYGKPPTKGEWGADRVLRGGYSPAEQRPDWNLGKPCSKMAGYAAGARERQALLTEDSAQQAQQGAQQQQGAGREGPTPREGSGMWSSVTTNAAASPTLAAAAGAPAGAGGALGPEGKRLGKGGGGATMVELLRPIESVYRGVTEEHFRQPRSRQEMWEVVTASGVVRDADSFERIYDRASRGGGNFGCCSLEGFIQARMELLKDQVLHREAPAPPAAALPPLGR